jgi:hypothetical protein
VSQEKTGIAVNYSKSDLENQFYVRIILKIRITNINNETMSTSCIGVWLKIKQAQKRPKVFGCAQIIFLLNTEQNHLTRLPTE